VIAVDTSSWIAYLSGDDGEDVLLVEQALRDQVVVMPPAVFCELLSEPALGPHLSGHFSRFPSLETQPGYWKRTGLLRAGVLGRKRRALLADALIARSCIDHDVALITRDSDYRWFARYGELKLL